MLDSNSLYVYDEDGNEKKMTILFTFDSDETGCQYVVFQDPDNDEVINTFVEDEENAD